MAGACVGRVFAIPSLGNVGALHGRTDCDQYGLGPRAICGRGANGPAGDCLLCAKLLAPLGDLCRLSFYVVLLHPANGPPAVPFHRGAARPGLAATPVDCKRKRKRGRSAGPLRRPKVPGYSRGRFMYAVKLLITILTVAYLYSYAQADVSHRPAGWAHAGN